jgi:hypothetical protein
MYTSIACKTSTDRPNPEACIQLSSDPVSPLLLFISHHFSPDYVHQLKVSIKCTIQVAYMPPCVFDSKHQNIMQGSFDLHTTHPYKIDPLVQFRPFRHFLLDVAKPFLHSFNFNFLFSSATGEISPMLVAGAYLWMR